MYFTWTLSFIIFVSILLWGRIGPLSTRRFRKTSSECSHGTSDHHDGPAFTLTAAQRISHNPSCPKSNSNRMSISWASTSGPIDENILPWCWNFEQQWIHHIPQQRIPALSTPDMKDVPFWVCTFLPQGTGLHYAFLHRAKKHSIMKYLLLCK